MTVFTAWGTRRFTYTADQESEIKQLLKLNGGTVSSVFEIVWMQWPKKNAPDVVRLIELMKDGK